MMNKFRLREDKRPDHVLCVQFGQAPVWFPAANPLLFLKHARAQFMLDNTVRRHKQRGVEKREVGVSRERILPEFEKSFLEEVS